MPFQENQSLGDADASSTAVPTRYSGVAIVLHWLIAALLLFEIGLGLRMEDSRGATKFAVFQLHKSIGITILLLVALRLMWRYHRTPPSLTSRGWESALARLVHGLFYLLLLALPISGWLIVSSSRIVVPTLLYGVIPWPHLPGFASMAPSGRDAWHAAGEFIHINLVNLAYLLVALHVAGALKHHFLDRDGDMARMAPGTKPGAWIDPRLIAIGLGVLAAAGLGLRWAPIGVHGSSTPSPAAPTAAPSRAAPPPVAPEAAPQPQAPAAASVDASANAAEAEVPSWSIAKGSTLGFRTRWSGDAVTGGFNRFNGTIVFSPDHLDQSHVEIRIDTASVFSGDAQRDETLKSSDWFSVASFGSSLFKADRFRKTGANSYLANGTLHLKGVTLPISLPFTLDINGAKATMRGTATVDRTAYRIGEGEYASTTDIPAAVSVSVMVRAMKKSPEQAARR